VKILLPFPTLNSNVNVEVAVGIIRPWTTGSPWQIKSVDSDLHLTIMARRWQRPSSTASGPAVDGLVDQWGSARCSRWRPPPELTLPTRSACKGPLDVPEMVCSIMCIRADHVQKREVSALGMSQNHATRSRVCDSVHPIADCPTE
jgi:hypothetical protein